MQKVTNRYPMLEGFKKLKQVQHGPRSPRFRVQEIGKPVKEALASCTVQDSFCQALRLPTIPQPLAPNLPGCQKWWDSGILGNLGINLNFKHRDSEDDARSLVR